jgi:hypothetical protein
MSAIPLQQLHVGGTFFDRHIGGSKKILSAAQLSLVTALGISAPHE